jgi:transcriptional regulator with XRE-family HTH domain
MKTQFSFYFLLVVFCTCSFISKAQVDVEDSLALVVLYDSTNGPSWTHHNNWLTGPVKDWYGIGLTDEKVSTISLSNNNLNGIIPISLVRLKKLRGVDLSHNNLNGNISPKLSYLFNLNNGSGCYLDLSYNQLSGNIPAQFGRICGFNLDAGAVDLSHNQLSGKIPPKLNEFCGYSFYGGYLNLSYNQLSGTIPPELGLIYLTNIFSGGSLDISHNQLSGNIPNFFGVISLDLNDNRVSGSLPEFSSERLEWLILDHNQLTGNINSIANLYNLSYLRLSNNKLEGPIPSEIGNLYFLQLLFLDHNKLSGAIPPMVNLTDLDSLDLSYNRFTFDGMESVAKTFPFAKYNRQANINKNISMRTSNYIKKASERIANRKWLKYSSNIARRISAAMEDIGINQIALADSMQVSAQYIIKVLSGTENLSLQTIAKLSDAVKVELISFPIYKDIFSTVEKSSAVTSNTDNLTGIIEQTNPNINDIKTSNTETVKKKTALLRNMANADVNEQSA